MKKCVIYLLILTSLIITPLNFIYAYDYIDPKNENIIREKMVEIYDTKQQYEDLAGPYDEEIKEEAPEIYMSSSESYWWPIGSVETEEVNGELFAMGEPETTKITSYFGKRPGVINSGSENHSALDIAGGSGLNSVNIIAAKDGIVVKVYTSCTSYGDYSCGGKPGKNNGYGNHIIIQHSDGNYTLYAHLHQNSITIKKGQAVKQGQVIAKMGSSGASTGPHLHFEVREGENSFSAVVDPLNYVDPDNPRPAISSSNDEFLSWLNSWEGSSPEDGDYYIVENIGDGVRTVGGGVTLEHNADRFASYGINVDDYPVGSKISKKIVDQIELEEVQSKRSSIENILANSSIILSEKQIQALISQMYNTGNIKGFVDNYIKYGNNQDLYNNWFFRAYMPGTIFEKGLTRRRNAEWSLFNKGEYVYNR